jgi:arabinan endo-1,5-alpha-L-arabinosidase
VLESENTEQPFAIDPAVFEDDSNHIWLVYGSHAQGIWMVELDKATGLLKENPTDKIWDITDERFIEVANYGGQLEENNIEAAYIFNHPDNSYYYLFVNWDVCCSGVNSTYNIRVGRSESPTGPFLDKNGIDLKSEGGTLFLDATGEIIGNDRFKGPGHSGIYRHSDGKYYFSHHFYDANNSGEASLAIWNLRWADGWPLLNVTEQVNL